MRLILFIITLGIFAELFTALNICFHKADSSYMMGEMEKEDNTEDNKEEVEKNENVKDKHLDMPLFLNTITCSNKTSNILPTMSDDALLHENHSFLFYPPPELSGFTA